MSMDHFLEEVAVKKKNSLNRTGFQLQTGKNSGRASEQQRRVHFRRRYFVDNDQHSGIE